MTRPEAKAFRKRWEAFHAIERIELSKTPMARKLQQLTSLMIWGRYFGWTEARTNGAATVRQRWNRLLRVYRG